MVVVLTVVVVTLPVVVVCDVLVVTVEVHSRLHMTGHKLRVSFPNSVNLPPASSLQSSLVYLSPHAVDSGLSWQEAGLYVVEVEVVAVAVVDAVVAVFEVAVVIDVQLPHITGQCCCAKARCSPVSSQSDHGMRVPHPTASATP